jgi:Arc/MetJ family transcription regulator
VGSVKTAVSLEADLFAELDAAAKSCGQSRSAVVAIALRKYLRDADTRRFMDSMNEAYADDPGLSEAERSAVRRRLYTLLAGDKW